MTEGMSDLTLAIGFALFGLLVGSFLNVCIYRLPRRESLMWPGSHCTRCDRSLAWFENVPVLSWMVLRGRCRTCGEGISAVYPLVEIVTASIFTSPIPRPSMPRSR